MLYQLLRPAFFCLDAECAHTLALQALDKLSMVLPKPDLRQDPIHLMGIDFPNCIGLAAGLDKNGRHVAALGKLGMGFIEVGTVTPLAQSGNPRPRLFRLVRPHAIINRMGFNNDGIDALITHIKASRAQYDGIIGINIGKNKDTPNECAIDDYIIGLEKAYPHTDYITLNISSPNTKGLRDLQQRDAVQSLLLALKARQIALSKHHGYKPLVIKISPDLSDEAMHEFAEICLALEVDGVIATNTTIDKSSVANDSHGQQTGGLSGRPLTDKSTHTIRCLAAAFGNRIPIIGVGGIMNSQDAIDKLQAGASLLQIYSGLIYQGPQLIKQLVSATRHYHNSKPL